MCGIVGVFGLNVGSYKLRLRHALDRLAHRGPDGEGFFEQCDGQVGIAIGHRRLAILDLSSAGEQPMRLGKWVLAFNGEIYNHWELRTTLLKEFEFKSVSDTETILAGVEFYGVSFLAKAKGMYAAALFDLEERKLYLFRDPHGIKPLYVAFADAGTLIFASEIKALAQLRENLLSIKCETLMCYLVYENFPASDSLFSEVRVLKQGTVQQFRVDRFDRVVEQKAIDLDVFARQEMQHTSSAEEIEDCVEAAIRGSVKDHLLSDVPIALTLSGGLDSSIVAAFAKDSGTALEAFVGYFKTSENGYDERPLAQLVATHFGLRLNEILISPSDFEEHFDKLVYTLEEPRMGMGSFSQFIVYRRISSSHRVVLTGHGGDELFGGYPAHRVATLLNGLAAKGKFSNFFLLSPKEYLWLSYGVFSHVVGRDVSYVPRIFEKLPPVFSDVSKPQPCRLSESLSKKFNPASVHQYFQEVYLQGLLSVEDKISMAHGLESRTPLWGDRLRHALRATALHSLGIDKESKYLLRRIAAKYLPLRVLRGPKRGFPTPLRAWFRHELWRFATERLLDCNSSLRDLFNSRTIESLLWRHRRLPLPAPLDELRAHQIWMLLNLDSWMRQFSLRLSA